MVVKKEVAVENLKPVVHYYVVRAITFLDSQLRNFIFGERKSYCLKDIFEEKDKTNTILIKDVVESIIGQYTDAGWTVTRDPDDPDENIVLSFW